MAHNKHLKNIKMLVSNVINSLFLFEEMLTKQFGSFIFFNKARQVGQQYSDI